MGNDRDQLHSQDAEGTLFVKAYVGCDSILDTDNLLIFESGLWVEQLQYSGVVSPLYVKQWD